MYIEDIIQKVVIECNWTFNQSPLQVFARSREFSILESMSYQLINHSALTEKQAALSLRILDSYKNILKEIIPNISEKLADPKWKYPFRVLHTESTICIEDDKIILTFPYDDELIKELRARNQENHQLHRGNWETTEKRWVYNLTEQNVLFLGHLWLNRNFKADATFSEYYEKVSGVLNNLESHVPMLAKTSKGYEIKNASHRIPYITTDNVVEAAFHARHHGIQIWDDAIEQELTNTCLTTKKILVSNKKTLLWFNSEDTSITDLTNLVKFGGKILVIVPGGLELRLTKNWVNFALSLGIKESEISVMFRLPNAKSEFNEYVRAAKLNNTISDDTKIVFVNTKIPKPLVKAGIKFTTIINLGYYNYLHFTMNSIVDNVCNIVYYSSAQPAENKKWQPQELS